MILATLAMICASQFGPPVQPDPAELLRVKEFLRFAHLGTGTEPLHAYDLQGEPEMRVVVPPSEALVGPYRHYRFEYAGVYVDGATGKIGLAYLTSTLEVKNARLAKGPIPWVLSEAEGQTLARRYYRAAGHEGDIALYDRRSESFAGEGGMMMSYVPAFKGVPYDRMLGGLIEIDPENGRLNYLQANLQRLPTPPTDLEPKKSAAEAVLAAGQKVLDTWNGVLRESIDVPTHLCLKQLYAKDESIPDLRSWATSEERARSAAGNAQLVYAVMIDDQTFMPTRSGKPAASRWYRCYVDAHDGRVLEIHRLGDGLGGKLGVKASFPLPSGKRQWRVSTPGRTWTRPVSGELRLVPGATWNGGKALSLTDGKTFLRVLYDRDTGLVGVQRPDESVAVAKPSASLKAALEQALQP